MANRNKLKVVLISFVILVLSLALSVSGYYAKSSEPPNILITSSNVHFTYNGKYSNFLNNSSDTLISGDLNPFNPNTTESQMIIIHNHQGQWFLQVFFDLDYNTSSPLYNLWNSEGYNLNDSAVLSSISAQTPGLAFTSFLDNGVSSVPCPLVPGRSNWGMLTFSISMEQYRGPLNISMNITSPASNMVIYEPTWQINGWGNDNTPVFANFTDVGGIQIGVNGFGTWTSCSSSVSVEMTLTCKSNFSLTGVDATSPFSTSNLSHPLAKRPLESSQLNPNGTYTYTYSPIYQMEVSFSLLLPQYSYNNSVCIYLNVGFA